MEMDKFWNSEWRKEGKDFTGGENQKQGVKMEVMDAVSFSINQLKANESALVKRKRLQYEVLLSSSNC